MIITCPPNCCSFTCFNFIKSRPNVISTRKMQTTEMSNCIWRFIFDFAKVTLMNLSALLSSDMVLLSGQMKSASPISDSWQWKQSVFLWPLQSLGLTTLGCTKARYITAGDRARPLRRNHIRPPISQSRVTFTRRPEAHQPVRCSVLPRSPTRSSSRLKLAVVTM